MRRTDSWTRGCFEAYLKNTWSPILFHSVCLSTSVHLERTARKNGVIGYPSRLMEQLHHKGAALRAIKDALLQPVLGPGILDEVLLSICFLAVHDDIQESFEKDYNPFNPPLMNLQGLDFYGYTSFHSLHAIHWNAILNLSMRKGGFHNIKLYGAPWFLSQ
jgi:hypothetical protein